MLGLLGSLTSPLPHDLAKPHFASRASWRPRSSSYGSGRKRESVIAALEFHRRLKLFYRSKALPWRDSFSSLS